MLRIRITREY